MDKKMVLRKPYIPAERESKKTALIEFEPGHEFHGAVVEVALAVSLEFLFEVDGFEQLAPAEQAHVIRRFGDIALVSWNVADRQGRSVPADGAGLIAQDIMLVRAILNGWAEAVAGLSVPFEPASSAGATSEAPAA